MRKIKRLLSLCLLVLFCCIGARIVNFFVFRPVDAEIVSIDETDVEKVQIVTYRYRYSSFNLTESVVVPARNRHIGDLARIRVNPINPPEIYDTLKLSVQSLAFFCLFAIWEVMRIRERKRGECYRIGFVDYINLSRFPERFEADKY